MKTYVEKLKDPRWQKKRLRILDRDRFTCRDCGNTNETLHVHHCYYAKGDPWNTPSKFLLTICNGCHERREKTERSLRLFFGEMLTLTPIDALEKLLENHGDASFDAIRQEALTWMHYSGLESEKDSFLQRLSQLTEIEESQ